MHSLDAFLIRKAGCLAGLSSAVLWHLLHPLTCVPALHPGVTGEIIVTGDEGLILVAEALKGLELRTDVALAVSVTTDI